MGYFILLFSILSLVNFQAQDDIQLYIPRENTDEFSHPTIEIKTIVHIIKKSDEDALGFAKKHLVDYLIGGNIRSAGKRIRVSVDLTDASDGSNLWGEKYDRVIEDIFDLQDEINKLKVQNICHW